MDWIKADRDDAATLQAVLENERYVRERWEHVEARWLPSMPDRFRVEMVYDSAMVWADIGSSGLVLTEIELTVRRAWSAARAFTEQRERDIADLREEIGWVESEIWADSQHDSPSDSNSPKRILARLQSALTVLQQGMKGSE